MANAPPNLLGLPRGVRDMILGEVLCYAASLRVAWDTISKPVNCRTPTYIENPCSCIHNIAVAYIAKTTYICYYIHGKMYVLAILHYRGPQMPSEHRILSTEYNGASRIWTIYAIFLSRFWAIWLKFGT